MGYTTALLQCLQSALTAVLHQESFALLPGELISHIVLGSSHLIYILTTHILVSQISPCCFLTTTLPIIIHIADRHLGT